MATLISLTKVGQFDVNGSYFPVSSEAARVQVSNISSIESHADGCQIMFANKQFLDGTYITGITVSQSVAAVQALVDASVSTVNAVQAVTADGAITIPSSNTTFYCTKAGVAAMTIANPTATTHDGLRLTFIATTANANTLSNAAGAGFNDGGAASDVGTFGGAKGDNIVIEAYQGKWYVVSKVNVTLA